MRLAGSVAEMARNRWTLGILGALLLILPVFAARLAPAGGEWAAVAIALLVLVVAFLLTPVRAIGMFAAYMLVIDSLVPVAGGRIKLLDELFIPAMVLITVFTCRHRLRSQVRPVRDVALLVLIGAALASSMISGVRPEVWVPGMSLLLKALAVFYVVLLHEVTDADVRWLLTSWLVLASGILAVGALQLAGAMVVGLGADGERAGVPVIASVFYHPQLFGWLCATAAIYLVAHHVVMRRRWMLALAMLFSLGTILSGRRRSMLALVGGLATGAATEVVRGRGRAMRLLGWLPTGVGVALIAVAFMPVFSGLYAMTIQGYADPVIQGGSSGNGAPQGEIHADTPARIALYEGSVMIAIDNFPLGAGLGRYGSWMSRVEYSDVYREYGMDRIFGLSPESPQFINDTFWPQILGETGVIGFFAYAVVIGWMGVELLRLRRVRDLPPAMTAVVLGTLMLFAQTLVESVASAILGSPSQAYLVMLAIAGTLSWVGARDREPSQRGGQ